MSASSHFHLAVVLGSLDPHVCGGRIQKARLGGSGLGDVCNVRMSVVKAAAARSSAQWPSEAFHYILKSAEFPVETPAEPARHFFLPLTVCVCACVCLQPENLAYLSGVNNSAMVSALVALVRQEGRLLSRGVGGGRAGKDHISQSAEWERRKHAQ